MDPFKELTSFVNVAQRGSLTAAARHEGLAPAMIGRRLDSLEARLGVKLIQRTTRRLTLTPEGIAFLEDCQRILRELEDAESAVSARGKQATGHLRITAPAGFGRAHIAPLVPRFVMSAQPSASTCSATCGVLMRLLVTSGIVMPAARRSSRIFFVTHANAPRGTLVAIVGTRAS